jgi:hypothetical protein
MENGEQRIQRQVNAEMKFQNDVIIYSGDLTQEQIKQLKSEGQKGTQVSNDLGGRNCSTCKNWDAYTTGIDEYPQCTGIAYCKKGHWENGRPNDDYTKCFIDCMDWELKDSLIHTNR